MASRDDRSPTLTASNTISDPSTPATTAASPKDERRNSRQGSSPLTSTAASPLPPFPREVFMSVLEHLTQHEKRLARLVSREWDATLVSEPSFWPDLMCNLAQPTSHYLLWAHRASTQPNKPRAGVKSVVFLVPCDPRRQWPTEYRPIADMHRRYVQALHAIASSSMRSDPDTGDEDATLEDVKIFIAPATPGAAELVKHMTTPLSMPIFARTRNIHIETNLHSTLLYFHWFRLFPQSVEQLDVRCLDPQPQFRGRTTVPRPDWQPDHVPASPGLPRLDCLTTLSLTGVVISPTLWWPFVPNLRSLRLHDVSLWGYGLFKLLRRASQTLEHLECNHLVFDFDFTDVEQDWRLSCFTHPFEKDQNDEDSDTDTDDLSDRDFETPPAIVMPRLQSLCLTGDTTPPFFVTLAHFVPMNAGPSFDSPNILMPALRLCSIVDLPLATDVVDEVSCPDPLQVLGMHAPNVEQLECSGLYVDDASLWRCLSSMHGQLTKLDIHETAVTDVVVGRLIDLVPRLDMLDVRGSLEISLQGVARLIENYRDRAVDPSSPRLKHVCVDVPAWRQQELAAWQWLKYHDFLVLLDWDPEGDGPSRPEARLRWKREGKIDCQHEAKLEMIREALGSKSRSRGADRRSDATGSVEETEAESEDEETELGGGSAASAAAAALKALALPVTEIIMPNKSFSRRPPCGPTRNPLPPLVPIIPGPPMPRRR